MNKEAIKAVAEGTNLLMTGKYVYVTEGPFGMNFRECIKRFGAHVRP